MSYRRLEHTSELELLIDADSEQAVFADAAAALAELARGSDDEAAARGEMWTSCSAPGSQGGSRSCARARRREGLTRRRPQLPHAQLVEAPPGIAHAAFQHLEERHLSLHEPAARGGDVKPLDAIDLGELLDRSRAGRRVVFRWLAPWNPSDGEGCGSA